MTSPPQDPGNPAHPYEPSRRTPPRYSSQGWPEGTDRDPRQQRGSVPPPRQLKRLLGLYATAYVFLKKGANWARITGTVLAILSSLGFLGNLFGFWLYGQWAIPLIGLGIAFIAVNIAWLVTAFGAPLRAWFTRPRYTR